MYIVVASTNPVKIQASRKGFQKVFPYKTLNVKGIKVDSGVAAQPKTDQETLDGATNRVLAAAKQVPKSDYWIGLEGGIDKTDGIFYSFAWVVIKSKQGQIGRSRTANFALPKPVVTKINQGEELGDAMDQIHNLENSKQHEGAVGIITGGLITRASLYTPAVILALKTLN